MEQDVASLRATHEALVRELASLRTQVALANERIHSLITTSLEMILCLEYRPPVPTSLPREEQADALIENAVIALCNDAASRRYADVPASQLVGKRLRDVVPFAVAPFRAQILEFIDAGYRQSLREYAIPLPDGGTSHIEINRHAAVVDDHVVRSWHISRDVTDREQRQERLRVSEERHRAYVEHSAEAVWCWEYRPPVDVTASEDEVITALGRDGVLTECNDAAVRAVHAASAADVIGKRWNDLFGSHGLEDASREFVRSGCRYSEVSLTIHGKDGKTHYLVNRATGDVQGGKLVQSWVTTRDETQRRVAEIALLESERRLQRARKLESLGILAGGMAHDFGSLLGAISGNVELARLELSRGKAVDGRLATIESAVTRAAAMVRQVLMFSRPREEQRPEALALQKTIAECARIITPSLPPHVRLTLRVDPACPRVAADATQMHQVLMNLISNACHAMAGRAGEIGVSLDLVTLQNGENRTTLPSGRYARLSVVDGGVGMSAETRERIFDPFFTTKGPGEGTGLGLSVVHGIVTGHGGEIAVESQLGVGTWFEVFLPALDEGQPPETLPPVQAPQPAPQPALRVLLVDDEQLICTMVGDVLTHKGFKVTALTSPAEALARFQASPDAFDVVVTDHAMPEIQGLELAARIVAARPGMPVLLLSGQAELMTEGELRRSGVAKLLGKPLAVSAIAEAIRALARARDGEDLAP